MVSKENNFERLCHKMVNLGYLVWMWIILLSFNIILVINARAHAYFENLELYIGFLTLCLNHLNVHHRAPKS